MTTRAIVWIASAFAALALLVTTSVSAAPPSGGRTDYLTFSGPVGLPGVSLPSGTYAFHVIDGHPDLVRVQSRDGSAIYFTGFTRSVTRPPRARRELAVTFSEVSRGTPARINTWYPGGLSTGRQFIYRD